MQDEETGRDRRAERTVDIDHQNKLYACDKCSAQK